ncbi:MAG TPA: polysaccharide deacetylase family protein [Polyangiaceae bacterium]
MTAPPGSALPKAVSPDPPVESSLRGCPAPAAPTDVIEVAVTVDDLPRHGADLPGVSRLSIHERMLAAFEKHRTPRVYGFVNAHSLEAHPEDEQALLAWVREGHLLANHTYAHVDGAQVSIKDFLLDVEKNEPVLNRLLPPTRHEPRRWNLFRYPYLREGKDPEAQALLRAALTERGYRIAQVTIDSHDWAFNAAYERCLARNDDAAIAGLEEHYLDHAVAELRWADGAARELVGRPIQHILLLHVGEFSARLLDRLLTAYEKNGVRFVSLQSALKDPIYASDPAVPMGNFLWRLRRVRGTRGPAIIPPPDTLLALVCR